MTNPQAERQRPRHVAVRLELEWSYRRHAAVFAGAAKYAADQGWELTIDEFAEETIAMAGAGRQPFDGVIARTTRKLAQHAATLNLPLVNVWYSSPARDQLPGVFPDWAAIGQMSAEHLLSRGLVRFAALIASGDKSQHLELTAFQSTLAGVGRSCLAVATPLRSQTSSSQWRKTQQTISGWMDRWQPPIGVYIAPINLSRTVVQMCRARGWRVPEDVAVVAAENEQTICEMPQPTLTSIDVGYERIGYEAARMLDGMMQQRAAGGQHAASQTFKSTPHVLLPPNGLIVRESTDFVAVEDPETAAALEFISANCHLAIRVRDVARAVALEPRTLQLRFRKYLKRSVADEIRRVRTERAKRELAQSDRSMAEIARAVGFGEPQRMYDVFVRELGISPSGYRRERQLGD